MYRIFLVEDDRALACALQRQLECCGNEVRIVSDFRAVSDEIRAYDPQLVLMDIMLPFQNGYYWTAELRKYSTVPVVFLSSASDGMNIVMAINMGGDDFIAKPVEPMVLNAKVQAVLRRTYEIAGTDRMPDFHGAYLNPGDASVVYDGQYISLTKNELRILQALIDNKGKIVRRDELMKTLWQNDMYVEENTLTVNVGRLRKKLEFHGLTDVIVTKPGIGYMIV